MWDCGGCQENNSKDCLLCSITNGREIPCRMCLSHQILMKLGVCTCEGCRSFLVGTIVQNDHQGAPSASQHDSGTPYGCTVCIQCLYQVWLRYDYWFKSYSCFSECGMKCQWEIVPEFILSVTSVSKLHAYNWNILTKT